jgi:hypothetical protein
VAAGCSAGGLSGVEVGVGVEVEVEEDFGEPLRDPLDGLPPHDPDGLPPPIPFPPLRRLPKKLVNDGRVELLDGRPALPP